VVVTLIKYPWLQVDMSCLVSTINWYHEMENGTEILIKVISVCGYE